MNKIFTIFTHDLIGTKPWALQYVRKIKQRYTRLSTEFKLQIIIEYIVDVFGGPAVCTVSAGCGSLA